MTRSYPCTLPVPNFPPKRAARFNRKARALAEAESLGIDLRDPFGPVWGDSFDPLADSGRRVFADLI